MIIEDIVNKVVTKFKVFDGISEDTVHERLRNIDITNIINTVNDKFKFRIWDKTSSINNIPSEVILNQAPYNIHDWNGITYIITDNGNDVLVQNHDHTKSELSYIETIDEATLLATEYIQLICESEVINILSSIVLDYDSRGE